MEDRVRIGLGIACAVVVLAFGAFWFIGQEASSSPTLQAPALAQRLYPGSWPPFARGVFWFAAGAGAVGFDLLIVRPVAETSRGRAAVMGAAIVTGAGFFAFAAFSFAGAPWTVIH